MRLSGKRIKFTTKTRRTQRKHKESTKKAQRKHKETPKDIMVKTLEIVSLMPARPPAKKLCGLPGSLEVYP